MAFQRYIDNGERQCLFIEIQFHDFFFHISVSHTTDWLSALSKFLKTLAMKKVNPSSKKERTILTIVRDWSRYLVAIMMALLETTSSVAASVILTLLMMSGDVERNPGPGRYPG